MSEVFGFVAEPHRNNCYFVSAATEEGDKVTCHDLSGFLGSWKMREGGVFFPTVSGETLCKEAMQMANDYAREKNAANEDKLAKRIRSFQNE
jgi:hypothetical protein